MPEGPELHLASLYVNKMCEGVVFSGAVRKSEVSKSPDVPFTCDAYRITATSRGKEVKLTLTPMKSDEPKQRAKAGQAVQPMDIVFRFGMSGFFRFTGEDELPKHAHLRFYSKEKPCRVLSFVDARRFGSWHPNGTWQAGRGPCIMFEYESFRENVVSHLSDRAFDRPICEVLLNQKYFNGIGNYLRAEVLFSICLSQGHTRDREGPNELPASVWEKQKGTGQFEVQIRVHDPSLKKKSDSMFSTVESHDQNKTKQSPIFMSVKVVSLQIGCEWFTFMSLLLNIPPFVPARAVLESLESEDLFGNQKPVKNEISDTKKKATKSGVKQETADLLRLCHTVPLEVVNLGGKGYDPQKEDYSGFEAWLQCYYVDGMKSIRDHNGRTMWFNGEAGPLAPKDSKSPKAKKRAKKEDDHDYTDKKKAAKSRSESTTKKKVKQEGVTKTSKKEKEARSRKKTEKTREVNTPQRETRSNARTRKSSSTETTAGPKRRNVRGTR